MFKIILFGEDLSKVILRKKKRIKKPNEKDLNPLEKIKKAIESSKKLEIEYVDSKGKETRRVIKPEKIENGKIIAYCYLRNEWRSFKIDRIKKIEMI